ncbi:hypothetical protein DL98DRAFT_661405 [Cadophora sp. DSE1049]|nr:hypothetical protein DL98DRAFT_661405 [Cadophora sp. DSE1049]
MGDKYKYPSPGSPTLYNPVAASPSFSTGPLSGRHRPNVIPSCYPNPRSSSSLSTAPVETSKYDIRIGAPLHSSRVSEASGTRSSKSYSYGRPIVPTIVSTTSRPHPVVHNRPQNQINGPYRLRQAEYYTTLPSSARERHMDGLRVEDGRGGAYGHGYTNSGGSTQHDLNNSTSPIASIKPVQLPKFGHVQSRMSNSQPSNRPMLRYHDQELRRPQREEYYETPDNDPRHKEKTSHHHGRRAVGLGHRPQNKPERFENRPEMSGGDNRLEHQRQGYKRGQVGAVEGLGFAGAGAVIGWSALDFVMDGRNGRGRKRTGKRRGYGEESPKRGVKEWVDLNGRDLKEQHRDNERDISPAPTEVSPVPRVFLPSYDRDVKDQTTPGSAFVDLRGRNLRERQVSREERDSDPERQEPGQHRLRVSNGTAAHSPSKRESNLAPALFHPNDIIGLEALKAALSKESATNSQTSRNSLAKDSCEASEMRSEIRVRGSRTQTENRHVRIVSPPREKEEEKEPVKGILRTPTKKFPEEPNFIREGVARLKDAKERSVPPDARRTKIRRELVNPEALEAGKERYEVREDFVIVLRVLSRDEVQQYAEVTQRIRVARETVDEEHAREERRRARREHYATVVIAAPRAIQRERSHPESYFR